MPSLTFWSLAACYGLATWFHGHIGSHVIAVAKQRDVTLNPTIFAAMLAYHWLFFLPWLFLALYGYKTVWWHAVALLAAGLVVRLVTTRIEMSFGWQRNAWAISLAGLVGFPLLLGLMLLLLLQSTGTAELLERCHTCAL